MSHTVGPSYPGTVVLDIGGSIGVLIIYTGAAGCGAEIEISPVAQPTHRTHSAVRERRLSHHTLYCAVYPGLAAGTYTIWNDLAPAATVTINAGEITELRH